MDSGARVLFLARPLLVLVGGEERGHVCERVLVGVARPVELAARVVGGAVALLLPRFCTVPRFTEEESAAVHTCEEGFESAHVFDCCRVAAADFVVPFVIYESGAGSASGFSGSIQAACGFREAFPGDDAFMVDAAGRFYRRDGNEATVVAGDSVERWDGASGRTVDIVNGGGVHELNVDDGYVRSVFGVNGGVVGGGFRAHRVLGCWFDEVTGEATLSEVGGDRNESSREAASRINVLSGDARVLSLASNCRIGSVVDNSKVNGVYGGSIGVVSGHGNVNIVQDGGSVSSVVDGGSVNRVEGDGATVGFIGGGLGVGESGGVVYRVHSGGHVETVAGRGAVEVVGPGGSVDAVDGKGGARSDCDKWRAR